jgi:hypothetical protein
MRVIRDDLSDRLIHLTRGPTYSAASATLAEILAQRALRGSSGCIRGGYTCVCFSEAPIAKLGYLLALPTAHGVRYMPYGIMLSKEWLYSLGGRPVIYQSDVEFDHLPEALRFRHVRYEPPRVDFSWEREWRIQTSSLALDPATVTVVVPTRAWVDRMKETYSRRVRARSTLGIPVTRSIASLPWHFIALEDLGVPIPEEAEDLPVASPSPDA